ncbi:MAG: pyrroloquinoline quinone-dependent dehydrogenase [Acidobacteria bacterium]|nr:pyrroloquinoline quinone-dependent dehydrogenase [Acidobacteriota bacterium]
MPRKLWALCALLCAALPLAAQTGTRNGEWRAYAGDPGSTKYSPLDQIARNNAKDLRIAWRFRTDNLGPRPDFNMQSVPLMVGGVMYVQAGTRRSVVALNPTTGEMLWVWRMDEGKRGAAAPRQGSGRGLAYWTDGKGDQRIVTITPGYQMVALNATNGVPVASFGKNGVVDLKTELDQPGIDLETADIGINSPPVIGNNVVVVGAAHLPGGAPRAKENVKGYVRGYDVRTGKRLWIFHTIPQPGEFGNDTWENDSWSYTGNGGNWAPITIDEELNRVYLATEDGTGDYFGGHRPGNNLFTSSVVSLDLNTGKRYWHFQAIHHDIWDWDFPAPPILMDITVNGKPIKAVAVPSKQAWLYTFDRVTGEPVWPIGERPVPRGKVPTEWYSPTQPYPTKPAAYDMQGIRDSDINDWTPEIKAEALRVLGLHKYSDNVYEPPIERGQDGKYGMIMMPGNNGGANWEGGAFDPETGIAYIFSSTQLNRRSLVNDPARSNMNYVDGGGAGEGGGAAAPSSAPALNAFGLPLIKPPYGRVTAINMNTGDHVWMQPIGNTPENIKNHEKLKGVTIPKTGRPGRTGIMVTKSLLWAGERGPLDTVNGQQVSWFRSYDKATGEIVSEMAIPANVTNIPMTYMANGKQYIVIAVAAADKPAELLALALP